MVYALKFSAYAACYLSWTAFWLVVYRLTDVSHARRQRRLKASGRAQ